MTVHEEELLRRIRELEKKNGYLNQQLKEHRYGLTWIDVPEAFEKASENKIPVLEEVKEKSFTDGSEKPTHILIEGDNYHVLTCLQYTHKGKIDVIYIDPPYNTGSDGFTYKDKRILTEYPDGTPVPKDHPLRHSYWLSFMHKRLELAKNLLSDDGVIFISIDDNEQANLKLLCDKVFGENNFVTNIIWQKKFSPQNDATWFSDNHDFVLCYAVHKDIWRPNLMRRSAETNARYKNLDNDPRGPWASTDLAVKTYSEDYDYPITTPSGKIVKPSNGRCWMTSKERMDALIADNRIWFGKKGSNMPRYKTFLSEVQQGIVPLTIWPHNEVGHNQGAKQELKKILHDIHNPFNTPKPSQLIKRILEIASKPNSIILDFFAGSGTTLHATLKLNAEDGGCRQCIMMQQNEGEKQICEEVTYERNRRVMQGYINAKGEQVVGLGGSLKYYRTTFTGTGNPHRNPIMLPSDEDRISLAKNAGVLVSLAENTLYEIVKNDYYQIFTNNHGRFSALYLQEDFKQFEDFRQGIEKLGGNVTVYIFSWGNNPDAANAFMHLPNVEVKSYPNAILDAYKSAMQQIESQK